MSNIFLNETKTTIESNDIIEKQLNHILDILNDSSDKSLHFIDYIIECLIKSGDISFTEAVSLRVCVIGYLRLK